MAKEIECKFLLNDRSVVKGRLGSRIVQGYIANEPMTVRVRLIEAAAFLTLKSKSLGIERDEYEFPIDISLGLTVILGVKAMAMVNRIVVGAHYGLKDWMAQRITAVIMVLYTLILIVALLAGSEVTQERWRQLLSGTFMRVATFLFILSLCYQAWVGVRDIWMDYLKPVGQRLFMHVVTIAALVAYAGWAMPILWRLQE